EAEKVVAAVEAQDPTATIDTVRKDPDGSYDALGTKDGSPVRYDVSADLKTVTEHTGGPGGKGGPGGPGDHGGPGGEAGTGGTTSTDPSDANATESAYSV
ncbi:hypothetical protein, partial [Phycicoccus flavus]|uniref:hypothetical protein n=1 Tax=Phycicoccus flavus TaxID=2502783 RepID=UPI00197C67FD